MPDLATPFRPRAGTPTAPAVPFGTSPRPVILTGGQARMVLALAYSLGRRGIPVVHLARGTESGQASSRHLRETIRLPSSSPSPEAFYAALESAALRWPGALVLPLNDGTLQDLAAAHARLSRSLVLGCPPAAVVQRTLDKLETARIAARLGLDVTRSFSLRHAADLEAAGASLPFPIFIKTSDKRRHLRRHGTADFGVGLHRDLASLRAAFAADADYGADFIFQEYVPGHDILLALLLHEGRVITAFQARSLRTWPSTGGVSVLTRSEPVDPVWCDRAAALLREIGWSGVAQLDLRHDPATGRTVLLEINGRFWGSVSAAIQSGVDFPYYVWQLAAGEVPVPPASYRTGVVTRWTMGDLKRLLRLWRQPFPGESPARELLRFLAAFRPGVRGMMWHWDDPAPAWSEWTDDLRWFAFATIRRLFGRHPRPPTP